MKKRSRPSVKPCSTPRRGWCARRAHAQDGRHDRGRCHIEVDAAITVEAGHDIAVAARQRVLQRHRVLNLMTHVDPWKRPDLDHARRR